MKKKEHPLVRWRKRHRISRNRLALASGVANSTIAAIERGARPRIDTYQRIFVAGIRLTGDAIRLKEWL
jgi:transcriptional regulator with XRE-family HTH domain